MCDAPLRDAIGPEKIVDLHAGNQFCPLSTEFIEQQVDVGLRQYVFAFPDGQVVLLAVILVRTF